MVKKRKASPMQLTFWDEPLTEYSHVKAEMCLIKDSQDNLRRGIFKRYDDVLNELNHLRRDIAKIKSELHMETYEFFTIEKAG